MASLAAHRRHEAPALIARLKQFFEEGQVAISRGIAAYAEALQTASAESASIPALSIDRYKASTASPSETATASALRRRMMAYGRVVAPSFRRARRHYARKRCRQFTRSEGLDQSGVGAAFASDVVDGRAVVYRGARNRDDWQLRPACAQLGD